MKIIVHAPPYVAGLAADLAAQLYESGQLAKHPLIGILREPHKFSIRLNKASVTVWHSLPGDEK